MISNELERYLTSAFQRAREARHQHVTVEHLLLVILDAPKVCEILGACRCDLAKLKEDLNDHIEHTTPRLTEGIENVVHPTVEFQRALQRAVFHAQSSGKNQVTASNVLFSILSEKKSHACQLLNNQNITRLDMMNYVSRGLTRPITRD